MEQERDLFARNLWRWKCGLKEEEPSLRVDVDELRRSQWCHEFELFMRNRLVLGAIRYGRLGAPHKPQYARMRSCIQRLEHYELSGNVEMLIDVANLCMIEFVEGRHPKRHMEEPGDALEKVKRHDDIDM